MSGDSISLPLPLARLDTWSGEASALYRELREPLLRYLVCLGLSADEAQDVVQDAFLSLHRHISSGASSGGPTENIRSWLFRVAHNGARNRQTSYARRFGVPIEAGADAIAGGASPERAVLEKEELRQVAKAVAALAEIERECLLLRAGGLRYREIGEVLGMAKSTVADTVERAIKKLAERCDVR
jgi:RNA polymerase sigma-70 factor (ECF subfamily)